jgi:hypothetical protein
MMRLIVFFTHSSDDWPSSLVDRPRLVRQDALANIRRRVRGLEAHRGFGLVGRIRIVMVAVRTEHHSACHGL